MTKKLVFETVKEGSTEVFVYKNKTSSKGPGSKEGVPFYNPSMELNRDLSIVVGQWLIDNKKDARLLDGLAASGIRGFRFTNELVGDFEVTINDWDEDSYNLIEKNKQKFKQHNVKTCNKNLNSLLSEEHFNYIDIDPFGSPVFFIDSAMRSITNDGIISCTATDTAALCGVYPKVCQRRYGAYPFHSIVMKEIGLRILLGFLCREAGKYDKGIEPLVCYSTDHYFRIYIRVRNGVPCANESISNLQMIKTGEYAGYEKVKRDIGPLWIGKLQNKRAIEELRTVLFEKQLGTKNEVWRLLDLLEEEADAPRFFYTTDSLASFLKTSPPRMNKFFEKIQKIGYDIFRTHFSTTGFKTDAPKDIIEKVFK